MSLNLVMSNSADSSRYQFLQNKKNKQCPIYLSDYCPLVNHNTENYNFRRKDFVLPLYTRAVKYQSSYFPATIRD
jgi:hypothetical protein